MDIVGCAVLHKTWGQGLIESCDRDIISVRFSATQKGEEVTKFYLPDAFRKGFLVAADCNADKCIQQLLTEYKCAICGADVVHTEPIDGKRFCISCKTQHTKICPHCGVLHAKTAMLPVIDDNYFYERTLICKTCAEAETFVCDRCGDRYSKDYQEPLKIGSRSLCNACYEAVARTCHFCGSQFNLDDGAAFFRNSGYVHVCPGCLEQETFICRKCGNRKLKVSMVSSKYIPLEDQVCDTCTTTCAVCNTAIYKQNAKQVFGKLYCPECFKTLMEECPCCGEEYIPQNSSQKMCPDCIEMEAYVCRLVNLDFCSRAYKAINYYSLDYIDRCQLFTSLYENCSELDNHDKFNSDSYEPFHFLVMSLVGYKTVITHLPKKVTGKVKCSENITMTEFRSRKGKFSVYTAIEQWIDRSTHYMETSAGKMQVLSYPVRLRVQTKYDKIYGKEWNGPDDYIEIGNYGDTTDFYIIGIL